MWWFEIHAEGHADYKYIKTHSFMDQGVFLTNVCRTKDTPHP